MKKIETMGIGTLIINAEIIKAYALTIAEISEKMGATFNDTKNICETLALLNANYNNQNAVKVSLEKAASIAHDRYLNNETIDFDDDDFNFAILDLLTEARIAVRNGYDI